MVNVVLFDTKYFLIVLGYCLVLPWVKTSLESISSTCKKKKKQNLTFVNFLLLPKFLPALQGSKSNAWVLVCTYLIICPCIHTPNESILYCTSRYGQNISHWSPKLLYNSSIWNILVYLTVLLKQTRWNIGKHFVFFNIFCSSEI